MIKTDLVDLAKILDHMGTEHLFTVVEQHYTNREDLIYNIYSVKKNKPDVLIATFYNKDAAEFCCKEMNREIN